MPGAPDRFARQEALAQRPAVVGALAADRQDLVAEADKEHGLLADMTAQHPAFRQGVHRHPFRKVGTGRLVALCCHRVLHHIGPVMQASASNRRGCEAEVPL